MAFHTKRAILCRIYVARNNKAYLGLHSKYPTFLSDLTNSGFSHRIFIKVRNVKFHGSRADTCGQTERRDEAFRCCTQFLRSRITRCLLESRGSQLFMKAL